MAAALTAVPVLAAGGGGGGGGDGGGVATAAASLEELILGTHQEVPTLPQRPPAVGSGALAAVTAAGLLVCATTMAAGWALARRGDVPPPSPPAGVPGVPSKVRADLTRSPPATAQLEGPTGQEVEEEVIAIARIHC